MMPMIEEGFEDYLRHYESGRVLFHQGTVGDCFYVIKDGLVGILRRLQDEEQQIATVGPGEVLGELALLDPERDEPRSATAQTTTEVTAWVFEREQFDHLMENSSEFRRKILAHVGDRLRRTSSDLARANQLEDQLYEASFALLHWLESEQLYPLSNHVQTLNPSLSTLSDYLNESIGRLKVYLSATDREALEELPDRHREDAWDVAHRLIQTVLGEHGFETPFEGEFADDKSTDHYSSIKEACQAAEHLNQVLDKETDILTRDRYESAWDEFDLIKSRLERARQQPDPNETDIRRLTAFVKGIRKKLQTINEDELNG